MARVPLRQPNQVRLRPVSSVKEQGSRSANDFGAGVGAAQAQAGAGIVKAGTQISTIATDMEIRNDETVAKKYDTEYSQGIEKIRNSFLSTRGENTVNARKAAEEELRKTRKAIEKNLKTDRQREMFSRAADARTSQATRTLDGHERAQRFKWETETSAARIANQAREAASTSDPAESERALEVGRRELKTLAERMGWSGEIQKQKLALYESGAYASIISARLDGGNRGAARALFKKYGSKLTPKVRSAIKKQLETSNLRANTQAQADIIMNDPRLSDEERRAAARNIKDSKVRDGTLQRINQRIREGKVDRRENARVNTEKAWNIILATKSLDSVKGAMWEGLPAATRVSMEKYLAKGKISTNWKVYNKIMDLSTSDFAAYDIGKNRGDLADREYLYLSKQIRRARTGSGGTEKSSDLLKYKDLINLNIERLALTKKGKGFEKSQYRVAALRALDSARKLKGKALNLSEQEEVINRISYEGRWRFSEENKIVEHWKTATVPESVYGQIKTMLETRNKTSKFKVSVTNKNIRVFWLQKVVKVPLSVLKKAYPEYFGK